MSTLNAELSVGQIAAELPASIRVFERHQIDFCCGGKVPVADACQARGLDAEELLKEIDAEVSHASPESGEADREWRTASLGSLVDHIVSNHHVYLKTNLPRIAAMVDKVLAAHSTRHGEVLEPLAMTFFAMREELDSHLMKEEMILFPLIRKIEAAGASGQPSAGFHCGSIQNPIRVMVMEHDSAGDALANMRRLTNGYTPPEDACNTFRGLYFELAALEADLHRHIHLENNILFPRAVEMEAGVR
jgi:regulator of cell morphogenesis and NO signaling